MAVELSLPTLTTILLTAAVDSINPCAIGVLILLVSTLVVTKRKDKMLKIGMMYIGAIFITYFSFGLGLITFLANIPQVVAEYISIAVGLVVVLAGLYEIKDFFWYGKGFSLAIPHKYIAKIQDRMQKLSIGTVLFLGVFVAAVELPCTGGPYLAITLILSQNFNFAAFIMLVLYNIIFVMPLVIILFMVMAGAKIQSIQGWKQANKGYMRYATGLLLIGLGWLLMLIANGTINLN
ncbi:MAG: cytochrome c biogenesis protein CcdA [Candidatus Woesearchaeota archaeon]|jgi:cytochrome c biogenesis protein CcdA